MLGKLLIFLLCNGTIRSQVKACLLLFCSKTSATIPWHLQFVLLSCVVRIDCFCYFSSSSVAAVYHHHHRHHHQSCELSDPLYNKRRKRGKRGEKARNCVQQKKCLSSDFHTHIFSQCVLTDTDQAFRALFLKKNVHRIYSTFKSSGVQK